MRLKVSTSSEYWEGMSDLQSLGRECQTGVYFPIIRDHVVGGLDQKLRLRAEP